MEIQEKKQFVISDIESLYSREVRKFKLLTRDEERQLFADYQNGNQRAKDALYNANLRLVISIANKFIGTLRKQKTVEFMDLVQAGNMGLIKAIEKFELGKETKLSTYATWWIRQSVHKFLADNKAIIRRPVYLQQMVSKYNKVLKKLYGKGVYYPTLELIASELDTSVDVIISIESFIYQKTVSIDEPIDNTDLMLENILSDDGEIADESVNWKMILVDLLEEASKILSPRELEVIRLRFGLGNGRNYTLEEIGEFYQVSRERIRQVQEIALNRLRGSKLVHDFISEYFEKDVSEVMTGLKSSFISRDVVVEMSDIETFLLFVQENISKHIPQVSFREGQKPIYDALIKSIEEGNTSMYIEGPTGIGKTFIEVLIADALLGASHDKVLLLTSKKTLLHQISNEITRFAPNRTNSIYGDGIKDLSGQIVVMTYDSYRSLPDEIAYAFRYVLLDEAHKGLGKKTYAKLSIQKKVSILIGFTATATYSENKNLQKFLGLEVYKISIREAIEMGLLCAVQLIMASVDIELKKKKKSESAAEYRDRLSLSIIQEGGNIAAARLYQELFQPRNLRGIMFALDVRQAENLVSVLEERGVRARIITANTKNRKILFESFKNHEFDVLVGIDVIKEGFDDVGVAVCIFAYPVQSLVDTIQGNGRVLRINEAFPSKLAYIVMLNFKGRDKQIFYHTLVDGLVFIEPEEETLFDFNEDLFAYNTILGVDFSKFENLSDVRYKDMTRQGNILSVSGPSLKVTDDSFYNNSSPVIDGSQKLQSDKYDLIMVDEASGLDIPLISKVSVTHRDIEKITRENDFFDYVNGLKREEVIKLGKAELKKREIDSYISLIKYGLEKMSQTTFGGFGKGLKFTNFFLKNSNATKLSLKLVKKLAEVFDWTFEQSVAEGKIELARYGIDSYYSLLDLGPRKFIQLDFGHFGQGTAFASWFLPDVEFKHFTLDNLKQLAEVFGWTFEQSIIEGKAELKKHGIDSHHSLVVCTSRKFNNLKLGKFKTAHTFLHWFLPNVDFTIATTEVLKKLAEVFDWTFEQSVAEGRVELKNQAFISYYGLVNYPTHDFRKLQFGKFGSGISFLHFFLPSIESKGVTKENLKQLAEVFGWTFEQSIIEGKAELKKHGIDSYDSLFNFKISELRDLDLGTFDKMYSFLNFFLPDIEFKALTKDVLEKLTHLFGWKQ